MGAIAEQTAALCRWISGQGERPDVVRRSSKFQIVIPQRVREQLGIRPGERLQVLTFDNRIEDNRIELLPIESPQELRGFLAGIDTTVVREPDRV